MTRLRLADGEVRAEIDPASGGAIASLYSVRDGERFDWLRPAPVHGDVDSMACFPLLPFCNRIRDGRFSFMGREVSLPANTPPSAHALHGMGWQRPWAVLAHSEQTVRLQLEHPAGSWPWHFRATQEIRLTAEGLVAQLEVENLDTQPMPLGLGFHPFFPHRASARIQVATEAMWESNAELLPTALARPAVVEQLRQGVPARELLLDNNFIGWDRVARIAFDDARALSMSATDPLDFVTLYAPPGAGFFCIEPVSNCTDWPNLKHLPIAERGGAILAPGAVCRASMRLAIRWDR